MSMRKGLVARLRSLVDLCLVPAAAAFSPVAYALGRHGHSMPRSRSVLDRIGVAVVRYHYYQPLVRKSELHKPLNQERSLPGLDLNEAGQFALLAQFHYADELRRFPMAKPDDPLGFHFGNDHFGPGDAEFLYDIVRHFRPGRIVEVGSGHSTRMASAAIRANKAEDPGYVCEHICIEPYEMPWLEQMDIQVIRERVELVDPRIFRELKANDILFIDSTHVIRPQGDVLCEYLEVLPQLASGVIVHVHDIFTPRDYPAKWVLDWRLMWNEQYLLEAFLSFNDQFQVLLAGNWLAHNHRDKLSEAAPILAERPGWDPGSFWFRRL